MKCAVIFDVDGVLVDSYAAHHEAWRAMAAAEGLPPFDEACFRRLFGTLSKPMMETLWGAGRYTDAQLAVLNERREAAYREIATANFPAMPGARELLAALHADGLALAVGSSGPPENVGLVLDRLGVRPWFGAVVTGRDVRQGKPDPEVFLTAAARLGIAPECCAVVEDAPPGVEAANRAGMASIGMAGGHAPARDLTAARLVVHTLAELTPAVLRRLIVR